MDLEKEIRLLIEIINKAEVKEEAAEVFQLAKAYAKDALHFLKKNMRDEALEAYAIAWAYIDALLHLKLAKVPSKFLSKFTVDKENF